MNERSARTEKRINSLADLIYYGGIALISGIWGNFSVESSWERYYMAQASNPSTTQQRRERIQRVVSEPSNDLVHLIPFSGLVYSKYDILDNQTGLK